MAKNDIIVAITGASGAPYAQRLLQILIQRGSKPHVVISEAGQHVYELETGRNFEDEFADQVHLYDAGNFAVPIASGSFPVRGMVIVPCTMGTLAAIAQGISQNLIHRAADVCLKERRPLILVPRETPLNRVHLNNMLAADEAGALILPPMPGFYHGPQTIVDLVDFVVARILEHLGLEQHLIPSWNP